MSYRCQLTGEVVPPGTPAIRVVVAVRPVTHPPRNRSDKRRIHGKRREVRDLGGSGFQIARELVVSPAAAATLASRQPLVEESRPRGKNRVKQIEDEMYGPEPEAPVTTSKRRWPN